MRVLHLCLASFYIEESRYQESMISEQNSKDGHDVYVIAGPLNNKNGVFFEEKSQKYTNKHNVKVEIIEYSKLLPKVINRRLRKYKRLYSKIEEIAPDVIVVHGAQSVDLKIVKKYISRNNSTKFIIDNHAAYYNSANSMLSRNVLHKFIYRNQIKSCEQYVDKFYAIGQEEKRFFHEMYNIENEKIDILRLPAIIESKDRIISIAKRMRDELHIADDVIVYMHSGRMCKEKGTEELVTSFNQYCGKKSILLLVGALNDDVKNCVETVINNDNRIKYLGWKSSEELDQLLCLADFYIQHKDVTATVQHAISKGCAVILSNKITEYQSYIRGNGFLINNISELNKILCSVEKGKIDFNKLKEESYILAKQLFDINTIANMCIDLDFMRE